MTKTTVKGHYKLKGLPVELEWELPLQSLEDTEVFEKIGDEMRRVTMLLKKKEAKWIKEGRNEKLRDEALRYLRWLFLPKPTTTE